MPALPLAAPQATGDVSDEEDEQQQQLESVALGGGPLDAVPKGETVEVRPVLRKCS